MSRVVVTGLPGAGKTTIGVRLAAMIGVRFLDKDDILEGLLGSSENPVEQRSALSRQADVAFEAQAKLDQGAVLVSFWRRPELSTTSGTPTEWLETLDDPVEVWCRCEPRLAVDRFRARRRHPGHGDDLRTPEELLQQFEVLDRLGPVGVGRLVTVDTNGDVDLGRVALAVRDVDHDERRIAEG